MRLKVDENQPMQHIGQYSSDSNVSQRTCQRIPLFRLKICVELYWKHSDVNVCSFFVRDSLAVNKISLGRPILHISARISYEVRGFAQTDVFSSTPPPLICPHLRSPGPRGEAIYGRWDIYGAGICKIGVFDQTNQSRLSAKGPKIPPEPDFSSLSAPQTTIIFFWLVSMPASFQPSNSELMSVPLCSVHRIELHVNRGLRQRWAVHGQHVQRYTHRSPTDCDCLNPTKIWKVSRKHLVYKQVWFGFRMIASMAFLKADPPPPGGGEQGSSPARGGSQPPPLPPTERPKKFCSRCHRQIIFLNMYRSGNLLEKNFVDTRKSKWQCLFLGGGRGVSANDCR